MPVLTPKLIHIHVHTCHVQDLPYLSPAPPTFPLTLLDTPPPCIIVLARLIGGMHLAVFFPTGLGHH